MEKGTVGMKNFKEGTKVLVFSILDNTMYKDGGDMKTWYELHEGHIVKNDVSGSIMYSCMTMVATVFIKTVRSLQENLLMIRLKNV